MILVSPVDEHASLNDCSVGDDVSGACRSIWVMNNSGFGFGYCSSWRNAGFELPSVRSVRRDKSCSFKMAQGVGLLCSCSPGLTAFSSPERQVNYTGVLYQVKTNLSQREVHLHEVFRVLELEIRLSAPHLAQLKPQSGAPSSEKTQVPARTPLHLPPMNPDSWGRCCGGTPCRGRVLYKPSQLWGELLPLPLCFTSFVSPIVHLVRVECQRPRRRYVSIRESCHGEDSPTSSGLLLLLKLPPKFSGSVRRFIHSVVPSNPFSVMYGLHAKTQVFKSAVDGKICVDVGDISSESDVILHGEHWIRR